MGNEALLTQNLRQKIMGPCNWFKEVPSRSNLDPNAYELMDMILAIKKVKDAIGSIPRDIEIEFLQFYKDRMGSFSRNGYGTSIVAYTLCETFFEKNDFSGKEIGPYGEALLKRMAELSRYTAWRRMQDPSYRHDNYTEFEEMKNNCKRALEEGTDLRFYYSAMINEVAPYRLKFERFVDEVVESTKIIYKPTSEQLESFKEEFEKGVLEQTVVLDSQVGNVTQLSAGSGGNIPTSNIFEALIKSGISIDGLLPENYGYSLELLSIRPGDGAIAQKMLNALLDKEKVKQK